MADEFGDETPEDRQRWQKEASTARMDAAIRKSIAGVLRIKADDDDAWSDFAEMFQRYRARRAWWADLQSRSLSGAIIAILSALAVWLASRYGNRL